MANEGPTFTSLAALTPAEQNEVIAEVTKEYAERYEEDMKDLLEKGALTFDPQKPKERLMSYMTETLAGDMPMVLNPDYLEQRREGLVGPLQAEEIGQLREQMQAMIQQGEQMAMQTGQQPPPPPELPPEVPQLWPGLLPSDLNPKNPFSDQPWQHFSKDFAKLLKRESERAESNGPLL